MSEPTGPGELTPDQADAPSGATDDLVLIGLNEIFKKNMQQA